MLFTVCMKLWERSLLTVSVGTASLQQRFVLRQNCICSSVGILNMCDSQSHLYAECRGKWKYEMLCCQICWQSVRNEKRACFSVLSHTMTDQIVISRTHLTLELPHMRWNFKHSLCGNRVVTLKERLEQLHWWRSRWFHSCQHWQVTTRFPDQSKQMNVEKNNNN